MAPDPVSTTQGSACSRVEPQFRTRSTSPPTAGNEARPSRATSPRSEKTGSRHRFASPDAAATGCAGPRTSAISATCFLATLLDGLAAIFWLDAAVVRFSGAAFAAFGFQLVMAAAVLTFVENTASAAALDDEMRDLQSLEH